MAAARVASGGTTPIMSGAGLFALLRRNWLMAILLAAGLVLRVLTQLAYQPALLFIDSIKYLFGAYAGNDPPGYQLALKVFLRVGTLPMVVASAAPGRPGHGRGAVPDPAPPRRAALARRPGDRTRSPGRLPAADRAVDHARHGVRGPDRRGPGRPALAAPAPGLDGAGRRTGPGCLGNGPAGRRDLHPARPGVRADHRPGMAGQADQGRRAVRRLCPAHPGDQLPELRDHQAFLARPVRRRDHLRPGGGRRRLCHAHASLLRARALPLPQPSRPAARTGWTTGPRHRSST